MPPPRLCLLLLSTLASSAAFTSARSPATPLTPPRTDHHRRLCASPPSMRLDTSQPRVLLRLAAIGGTLGPLVDAVHNQALLQYDLLPLTLGALHTSWLVPPLLAVAYAVLGGILPALAFALGARLRGGAAEAEVQAALPLRRWSLALCVLTTVAILKGSEILVRSSVIGAPLAR